MLLRGEEGFRKIGGPLRPFLWCFEHLSKSNWGAGGSFAAIPSGSGGLGWVGLQTLS